MTSLARANLVLLALQLAHVADHSFNQPSRHLAAEVLAPGILGLAASATIVALALRRSPLAGPASALVGFATFGGFVAVHLLPHWSAFSDPYSDLSPNALSWLLVAAPMTAALIVGVLGLMAMPRTRPAPS